MRLNNKKNILSYTLPLILLIIILIPFFKIKYNGIKEQAFHKKMEKYLKSKYDNVSNIKFEKKENLLESYNTIAGDSGSGRRKLKSYIYYYRFKYNNINTYAYIIGEEYSDDYYYEKQLELARDEFKKLFNSNISIVKDYMDPEELLSEGDFRKGIIDIDEYSYNVINTAFMDKYISIYKKIKKLPSDSRLKLFLKFKDNVVLLNWYDISGKHVYEIEFKRYNYENVSEFINEIDEYSFDGTTISSDSNEQTIQWCLKNKIQYSCGNKAHESYQILQNFYDSLSKNSLIKYKIVDEMIAEHNINVHMYLYVESFEQLNKYIKELNENNIFMNEIKWEIDVFNNVNLYDDVNHYGSDELEIASDYNLNIYTNYINSNKQKYNNYILKYTNKSGLCNENKDICTILYGVKN